MRTDVRPVPRLELRGISKGYPTVLANDNIDLAVAPGEIHALLGENGAGKSTLMKIVYGVTRPDAGSVRWNGNPVHIHSPAQARRIGIGMVFQHFSLFETLTVAENIALALDYPVKPVTLAARIAEVSEHYGLPVDPRRLVHSMSVGARQRVERPFIGQPGCHRLPQVRKPLVHAPGPGKSHHIALHQFHPVMHCRGR